MDKTPLESKKWTLSLLGILAVMASGALATMAGPAGVAVLPYVVGGITAVVGSGVWSQGKVDQAQIKQVQSEISK